MNEDYRFIKKNGIFYTDKKLAKKMVNLLAIDYNKKFTLIEPAVGEGHILSIIVENFLKKNRVLNEEEKAEFLEKNISGFDIRDDAIEKCIEKLDDISRKYINRKIAWNVTKFDALRKEEIFETFGQYDYVISNPPYVSRHNMDASTITALRDKSHFCHKFNFDLYYYFFEIGFDLWNKKGKLVYITPNSYIKARSGETMMKYLLDKSLIEIIIDFEDEMKFEGATTYTAITTCSVNNKILTVRNKSGKIIVKHSYKNLIKENGYKIYTHNFLKEKGSEFISLGEISEVRNGLATLNDKVFVIKENEITKETKTYLYFKKNGIDSRIEKSATRKAIRTSKINEKNYVIFPYDASNINSVNFKKKLDLKKQLPDTYNYLEKQLSDKYKEKYSLYFGRTQGFTCYYGKKIIIPKVASLEDTPFKIVDQGFLLSGLSIKLKKEFSDSNLQHILDYLNSDIVREYLSTSSKNYAAGYKSISSTDLKMIKIPKKYLLMAK